MGYQRRRLKNMATQRRHGFKGIGGISKAATVKASCQQRRIFCRSLIKSVGGLSYASTYQRRLRPRLMSYANIGGFHFMKAISKASADYNSERSGGGGLMSKAAAYHQRLIKYV